MFNIFNYFNASIKKEQDNKEYILKALPREKESRARFLIRELKDINTFSNINDYFVKHSELQGILKEAVDKVKVSTKTPKKIKDAVQMYDPANTDYQPAMCSLYQLFNNPFAVYSFIVKHHPATHSAINIIREEVANDGYTLQTEKGLSKKRIKDVYKLLKKNKIASLRVRMAAQLKTYGNCWVYLDKKTKTYILLAPTKILPLIDPLTDDIVGWEYVKGSKKFKYRLDEVAHLYLYSSDDYSGLGDPPLGPALIDIEADMAAAAFNNQTFRKGGLMGIILSIDAPEVDPNSDVDPEELVEDLQDRIDSQFSGVKAGQSVLVATNLKGVHTVGRDLDSSFKTLRVEAAKTVASCLGVPPEKISVNRSDAVQYVASLVEDSVNAQFDKTIYCLVEIIDEFINDNLLRGLWNITDVRVEASGRFGSLTKNAADTIKILADAGPILTINMAFERVLGWEALPPDNPRGQLVLDNSVNRKIDSVPQLTDPDKPNYDLMKSLESDTGTGLYNSKEVTYSSDNEIVHFAKIKRDNIKFYQYKLGTKGIQDAKQEIYTKDQES